MSKETSIITRTFGLVAVYLIEVFIISILIPSGMLDRLTLALMELMRFIIKPVVSSSAVSYAITVLSLAYFTILALSLVMILWANWKIIKKQLGWLILLTLGLIGLAEMILLSALEHSMSFRHTEFFQYLLADVTFLTCTPIFFLVAAKSLWMITKPKVSAQIQPHPLN